VHEVVSSVEAYRAARTEAELLNDDEGALVTVAYVKGDKPGKSFARWQQTVGSSKIETSQGGAVDSRRARNPKDAAAGKSKPVDPCSGKCCFRCGKTGHFIANWDRQSNRCLFITLDTGPKSKDEAQLACECECSKHTHFMAHSDLEMALSVLTARKEKEKPKKK